MKKILFLLVIVILILSCNDEKLKDAELQDFDIVDISILDIELIKSEIINESNRVLLYINDDLNLQSFPLTLHAELTISKGAKTSLKNGGEIIFNNSDEVYSFDIESEDGNLVSWEITLIHKQLQNSNFENWIDNKGLNGEFYKEIGSSVETSIWSTANMGTSTYSIYGTQPIIANNNTLVQIRTDSVKTLPLTAATLFTGTFNLSGAIANPSDPKKATIFGTPFPFSPKAFKVRYKYAAGNWYKQATLKNSNNIFGGFDEEGISGEDQCAIYAILENRNGDSVTEIAKAELYSNSTTDELIETTITFNYTSQLTPTHITVVFSSSKDGDLWRGAVGSTLVIDDLEFIYD
jgi:hypothetical protein